MSEPIVVHDLETVEPVVRRMAGYGKTTPRWLRQLVRETHAARAVQLLADVMDGNVMGAAVGRSGELIAVPASPKVRLEAAMALLRLAVPPQVALTDSDGDAVGGVIALGQLELREIQKAAKTQRALLSAGDGDEAGPPQST